MLANTALHSCGWVPGPVVSMSDENSVSFYAFKNFPDLEALSSLGSVVVKSVPSCVAPLPSLPNSPARHVALIVDSEASIHDISGSQIAQLRSLPSPPLWFTVAEAFIAVSLENQQTVLFKRSLGRLTRVAVLPSTNFHVTAALSPIVAVVGPLDVLTPSPVGIGGSDGQKDAVTPSMPIRTVVAGFAEGTYNRVSQLLSQSLGQEGPRAVRQSRPSAISQALHLYTCDGIPVSTLPLPPGFQACIAAGASDGSSIAIADISGRVVLRFDLIWSPGAVSISSVRALERGVTRNRPAALITRADVTILVSTNHSTVHVWNSEPDGSHTVLRPTFTSAAGCGSVSTCFGPNGSVIIINGDDILQLGGGEARIRLTNAIQKGLLQQQYLPSAVTLGIERETVASIPIYTCALLRPLLSHPKWTIGRRGSPALAAQSSVSMMIIAALEAPLVAHSVSESIASSESIAMPILEIVDGDQDENPGTLSETGGDEDDTSATGSSGSSPAPEPLFSAIGRRSGGTRVALSRFDRSDDTSSPPPRDDRSDGDLDRKPAPEVISSRPSRKGKGRSKGRRR